MDSLFEAATSGTRIEDFDMWRERLRRLLAVSIQKSEQLTGAAIGEEMEQDFCIRVLSCVAVAENRGDGWVCSTTLGIGGSPDDIGGRASDE